MENTSENKSNQIISRNIKIKKKESVKKCISKKYALIKNKLIFIFKKLFHKKNSNKFKFNNNKIIINIKNNKIIIIINNK